MWFSRKPSVMDQLLEMMREDRRIMQEGQQAQLRMMQGMLEASTAQAGIIRDYLKIFTEAPQPEVRVMTNMDEVATEERLRQLKLRDDQQVLEKLPVSIEEWNGQMDQLFDDMKGSF